MGLAALTLAIAAGVPDWITQTWLKPHYQFTLLIPLGAIYLARERLRETSTQSEPRRAASPLARCSLYLGTALVLTLSWALHSTSIWLVGTIAAVLAALVDFGGLSITHRVAGCWALLWLMLPLPLGIDYLLLLKLQLATTRIASEILDGVFGIPHVADGNVLHLASASLFVDQACSGIHSFFSVLTVLFFTIVLIRRSVAHHVVLLLVGLPLVLVGNVARIVALAVAHAYAPDFGKALDGDPAHTLLGLAVFGIVLLLVFSLDRALLAGSHTLFTAIPKAWARRRDPDAYRSTSPNLYDFPYGSPTMIWSRRSSARRAGSPPRTRLSSSSPPVLGYGLAAAFACIGCLELATLVRGQAEPRFASMPSLTRTTLPEEWSGYRKASFESQDPASSMLRAKQCAVWKYQRPGQVVVVSAYYPYSHWHAFETCYEGSGWKVEYLQGGRSKDLNTATVGDEFPWIRFEASKSGESRRLVTYTFFDCRDGVVPFPLSTHAGTFDLLERMKMRWRTTIREHHALGLVVTAELPGGAEPPWDGLVSLLIGARHRIRSEATATR